jgi:biopolymer transport protein ExbB/TolQ
MPTPDMNQLGPLLNQLSGVTTVVIVAAALAHIVLYFGLWVWSGRDMRILAGCLDDFTRNIKHRSILGRTAPLTNQIDAFVEDINDIVSDVNRREDRIECLRRIHILDEKRRYMDSMGFETVTNMARTMIEAYPLAGVLGTILAIGAALQQDATASTAVTMNSIVTRFGDAIWSTFAGLSAAILLMFINSLLETRFQRLATSRSHVRDMVARAKRELSMSVTLREESAE